MSGEEIRWFAELWPEALPEGSPPTDLPWPDPNHIREWARKPLFYPIAIPGHERRRRGGSDR